MFKKLITLGLVLTMMASTSIPTHAAQTMDVNYFNRDIFVNGEKIVNYQSETPYFLASNSTYIPLTAENAKIFGYNFNVNDKEKQVEISKANTSQKNYSSRSLKNTTAKFKVEITQYDLVYVSDQKEAQETAKSSTRVEATDLETSSMPALTASEGSVAENAAEEKPVSEGNGSVPAELETEKEPPKPDEDNEREVDLKSTSILKYKNTFYVAVKALTSIQELGWSAHYNDYVGIYISTVADKPAKSYLNESAAKTNKNLAAFMMKDHGSMKEPAALNLLFLVKQKAQIYQVDELLILSVIAGESSFNEKAKSRSGALGLMQIMPSTGATAGFSRDELLTADRNLDFGVKYLSGSIKNFGGEWHKGLSAYNQGSRAVSRGSFSRSYSTKIMTAYKTLKGKVVK